MTRNLDATPIPGHDARLDRQSHVPVDDKMCHVDRVKLLQDGSKCNIAGVPARRRICTVSLSVSGLPSLWCEYASPMLTAEQSTGVV